MMKSYIIIVVLLLMHCFSIAQDTTGVASDTSGIEAVKTRFVQKVGQFFDVRMLDHSIQTRGTVKKQGLKDSLKVFVDKTEGKLNVAIISSLNISEVWPNILNRKKYYSVDGKFELDSTFFSNPDSTLVKDAYIIGLEIDVDTLVTDREYGITITGDIDENIAAFLAEKGITTLESEINQYFVDYFAANSGPWASPNDAPVADAIMGCLALLDAKLSPYYAELMFAQSVSGLVSDVFEEANEGFQVKFKADSSQSFGYDWYQYLPWIEEYDFARLGDGKIYNVNVKSNKKGFVGEKVKALLIDSLAPSGFDIANISFKTKQGDDLTVVVNGKEFVINLPTYTSNGTKVIYAYHNEDPIGKLTVEVYGGKEEKVVIVPVNCDVNLTASQIETYLDLIYTRGVVDWEVQLENRFDNATWDSITPGKLESADATLMSKYSDEMRGLRDVYFEVFSDSIVSEAFYLFVVPDFTNSSQLGYMVRGKSIGFIKNVPNTSSLKKTIGHELGHGAFGLKHNFEDIPKLSSDRLMDYSLLQTSTHLSKSEWDEINSWLPVFSFLDDEEDGKYIVVNINEDLESLMNLDTTYTFYSPSGKPITLKGEISSLMFATFEDSWHSGGVAIDGTYFPTGCLMAFTIDNEEFRGRKKSGLNEFIGYESETTDSLYIDTLSANNGNYVPIVALPSFSKDGFMVRLFKSKDNISSFQFDTNYAAKGEQVSINHLFSEFSISENIKKGVRMSPSYGMSVDEGNFALIRDLLFNNDPESYADGEFYLSGYNFMLSNSAKVSFDGEPINLSTDIMLDAEPDQTFVNDETEYIGSEALMLYRLAYFLENAESPQSCVENLSQYVSRNSFETLFESLKSSVDSESFAINSMKIGREYQDVAICTLAVMHDMRVYIPENYIQALLYNDANEAQYKAMRVYSIFKYLDIIVNAIDIAHYNNESVDEEPITDFSSDVIIGFLDKKNEEFELTQNCLLENLNVPTKLKFIKRVYDWYLAGGKEELVVRILENTTNEQFIEIYEVMKEDDCKLFHQMLGDIWTGKLDRLARAITIHMFDKYVAGEIPRSDKVFPLYHDGIWPFDSEIERSFDKCEVTLEAQINFEWNVTGTYDPEEMVNFVLKDDFNFITSDLTTGNSIGIGDTVLLPAFWIYYMLGEEADQTNSIIGRVVAEAIIIAATWGSATPAVMWLETGLLTADFAISWIQNENSQNETINTVAKVFNTLSMAVGGAQLLNGISKWIAKKSLSGNKVVYEIVKDELPDAIDEVGDLVVLSKNIDDAIVALKNSGFTDVNKQALIDYLVQSKSQVQLAQKYDNVGKGILTVESKDVYHLTNVSNSGIPNGSKFKLAEVVEQSDLPEVVLTNLRKYEGAAAGTTELLELKKIPVKYADEIRVETFKVISNPSGQVFMKLNPQKSLITFLGDGVSTNKNLKTWINSFDEINDIEFLDKFYESIRGLSTSQVNRLNSALVKVDGTINNALGDLLVKLSEGGTNALVKISASTFKVGSDVHLLARLADDLANAPAVFRNGITTKPALIDAWEMLLRNGRTGLKTDVDALTSLNTLLNNSKLASKLPGKTAIEIENLLANMKGWSGASYKEVCDKVNLLIDELPVNVTGLDKYLGSAGFGNAGMYTNRHSWVQLERMLETANKSYIKSADEIVFENPISSSFGNSVSDIAIFKSGRRVEVETKAGLQFFEGVSGSNFPTQSANSLLNVTDVADYKVFLNPTKIATLSNVDKLNVVNAWKGNSGDFLGNAQIRQLFTAYWDDVPSIVSNAQFENLLKTKSDWFDDIFKNNIGL